MEEKIKMMYRGDSLLIIAFTIFLWTILIYTMTIVSGLASNHTVRIIALGSAVLAGLSVTSGLLAVMEHLKKNQVQLYTEDIMCAYATEEHNELGSLWVMCCTLHSHSD